MEKYLEEFKKIYGSRETFDELFGKMGIEVENPIDWLSKALKEVREEGIEEGSSYYRDPLYRKEIREDTLREIEEEIGNCRIINIKNSKGETNEDNIELEDEMDTWNEAIDTALAKLNSLKGAKK